MYITDKEGNRFKLNAPKTGYLTLINPDKPCQFSRDVLDVIYNNIIPDDIERIGSILDILLPFCYDDAALRCYYKVFSLVDIVPVCVDISTFDFTNYLNVIKPTIALQIMDVTIHTVDYDQLLIRICYTDNLELLKLIENRVKVKNYHIKIACNMCSSNILKYKGWYLIHNITNRKMFELYYELGGPDISYSYNILRYDLVEYVHVPRLDKDVLLLLAVLHNSTKIINVLLDEDTRTDIGNILCFALSVGNDKVIEKRTGININNYSDLNRFILDLDRYVPGIRDNNYLPKYAVMKGNLDLLKLCPRKDVIHLAIKHDKFDIVNYLCKDIAPVCEANKIWMIKSMSITQTEVNITTGCSVELIQYLKSIGIKLNFGEYDGSNLDVVKYLGNELDLDKIYLRACDGFSNLHLAEYLCNICNMDDVNEDVRVVNLLFRH